MLFQKRWGQNPPFKKMENWTGIQIGSDHSVYSEFWI